MSFQNTKNKFKMKKIVLLAALLTAIPTSAQLLRHNFDEQGDTFIQGIARGQFWARFAETNPGTIVQGKEVDKTFDFSVRRVRLGLFAQIQKKWLFYILLGNNNLNQKTLGSTDFRLLDLMAQYSFNEQLNIGIGKVTFLGAGRYAYAFANGSMLNLDPSIYYLHTSGHFDDMGRRLGVYAKGQLDKLEYCVSLQSPSIPSGTLAKTFSYSSGQPKILTASYLKYEFWDNEPNRLLTSGGVGTYLGTKHILNLGMGYEYLPKMREITNGADKSYHDYFNFGIDLFIDTPISTKNDAITTYLGFNSFHFGNDYLRSIGANSIFEKGTSFNGAGTATPAIGSGNTILFQFGYLFPKWENTKVRLQPNVGWHFADYKALSGYAHTYTVGVNSYFNGQKSKLSFGYENRPIFSKTTKEQTTRLGTFVLQYQIEL